MIGMRSISSMSSVVVCVVAFGLAGCVTTAEEQTRRQQALRAWVGKDASLVLASYGPPIASHERGALQMVIYGNEEVRGPSNLGSTLAGTGLMKPKYAGLLNTSRSTRYFCKVQFTIDKKTQKVKFATILERKEGLATRPCNDLLRYPPTASR